MRLLLLENAIDSFEWTLRHLEHFLKIDSNFENPDISTTYLKQAIISLNTALELFFKAKISDINPLLIYEHITTDDIPSSIIRYYSKMKKSEINEPLYNYMIVNSDIHTIDYSKCIELYCDLYSVPMGNKKDFIKLNGIRNKLVHLGISSKTEYYVLAGRIANILRFIQYNILNDLNYDNEHIEKICSDILSIEFTLTSLEDEIWFKDNTNKIKIICNNIEDIFNSKEITNYMSEKNVKAVFGLTLDMPFSKAIFSIELEGKEYEIASVYSFPNNNSLLISDTVDVNGPVYGVITLSETENLPSNFYLAKSETGIEIPNFCEQGEFWKSKPYKDSFAYVPYGKNKLTDMIKIIIDIMSTVEIKPIEF